MHSYKYCLTVLLIIMTLASCRKYVEEVPVQGQRVLVYTNDYRLLLNNTDQQETAYGLGPILSCDDADLLAPAIQTNLTTSVIQAKMYTWAKPFYVDQQTDNDWNSLYSAIYVYNVVIDGVKDSKGGDDIMKNTIMGEALLHRAFNYFMLVNMYAKQYDATTAETDLGVPVLLKPSLFVDLTRPSVSAVYDQILSDTRTALSLLPVSQEINFKPNKAAAYALLSKIYLNRRDFTNAAAYADSTLALRSGLYDYNIATASSTYIFPSQYQDVQVILRKVPRIMYGTLQLNQSLLNLLGTKDLRYALFVKAGTSFSPSFTGFGFWSRERYSPDKPAVGLTVTDTWLIKAECLARAGKKNEAVAMLNTLRRFRFKPADYVDLTAATADEALQLVINERRLEFFGSGMRWFDQRRLCKDPQFAQTYSRVFNNATYTLEPNSNGWVFPLGSLLISQNPELKQNP